MAGIARTTQVIFSTTGLTPTGGFAAAANGTTTTEAGSSNTSANIMTGQAGEWAAGWLSAVLGASKFPAIEDMNGVFNVVTSQLAYILERGIPEYDSGTSYNIGDISKGVGASTIFKSLTNANSGNALPTTPFSNANWQACGDLAAQPIALTANTSFYVATTGSDSNYGTSASPWLTIQHAINFIQQYINLAGFTATISVADGTYTGNISVQTPFSNGTVSLQGDTTTPANCFLNTTGDAINVSNDAHLTVGGFKIASTGNAFNVGPGGIVFISGNMNFAACSSGIHLYANFGGQIIVQSNYTISGGAEYHWQAIFGGSIQAQGNTYTLSGTPAFSSYFANVNGPGSTINCYSATFSGSATGARYNAENLGLINTNGGGTSYLPGNSGGIGTTPGTSPYGLYL